MEDKTLVCSDCGAEFCIYSRRTGVLQGKRIRQRAQEMQGM